MTMINHFKTFLTWNVNYLQFEPKKAKGLQMVTKHQRDRSGGGYKNVHSTGCMMETSEDSHRTTATELDSTTKHQSD